VSSTSKVKEVDPPKTVGDVRKRVDDLGIEFIFAQFVDMHARPSAKLVPAQHLEDLFTDGAGFAGFAAGDIGQTPNSPDLAAMPDPRSFTPVPWQPNLARLASDVWVEGKPWPYCPRTILGHQLEAARKKGYLFMLGAEAEFFLLKREDGQLKLADPLDTLERPCYDIKGLTRNYDFISTLSKYENELGWDNYANDHEDANCQFESNFRFSDALTTADRVVFFRYMVQMMAQQQGLLATFMPKPFSNLTGSGCHFHMSLWDAKTNKNLFEDPHDPRGFGLSDLAYNFIGGLKKHATAYIAVTAPTINSYKRLVIGAPTSGATWAPAYVTYGSNNRTQMLRVPAGGRVEDRTVDGSCNPYLAATVILASGLDGVLNKLDPGDPNLTNMYEMPAEERKKRGIDVLPANLLDAVRNLEKDEVIREALGRAINEDYIDYYAGVKRREWQSYHETVTDWEREKYLSLV
jgi:glutamine synthetase